MYCTPASPNISSTSKDPHFYFYDFNLPLDSSSNYISSCSPKQNYRDRLYDNVPRQKLDNLARSRSESISAAVLLEESAYRPIAEVKPFFVYSTTEQAVASAEQRLYDAVYNLSRNRSTLTPTPKTFSTPVIPRRNAMTPQPIMGTSRTIWPKSADNSSNVQINRSFSIGNTQHDVSVPISRQHSSAGVTIGRRSFYPVYRGGNVNTPVVTQKNPSYYSPTNEFIPERYSQNNAYFTPINANHDYSTKLYGHSYLDNVQCVPEPRSYVHNSPSNSAQHKNAAPRMQLDDRANKLIDSPGWTRHQYSSDNSLSIDEISSIPTTYSSTRVSCQSCNKRGIDCGNQAYSDTFVKSKKNSVSSTGCNQGEPIYNTCNKKKAPLPPYDSLYSISNITYSSSSSAYSSSSTPPELSELSVNVNEYRSNTPPPYMKIPHSPRPSNDIRSKINIAPPRPECKPHIPKTIAAVSPNHVSTVSVPEIYEINSRPNSAIPFDNKSVNEMPICLKKYSTLRPTKPPPPPPHQIMRSFASKLPEKPIPKEPKKNKKNDKVALKRAQSKLSFVDAFFQTGLGYFFLFFSNLSYYNNLLIVFF